MADAAGLLGRFVEARRRNYQWIDISRQNGLRFSLAGAYDHLIGFALEVDRPSDAAKLLEEGRGSMSDLAI
ncbi:MAG TPA: hypothetical protein VFA81_00875, partial [Burkholderiales bacterium]|nr:hypothetical protein [Burkholderiales bacterium]